MKYTLPLFLCLLWPASCEALHYAVSWPSGLSLGEASMSSEHKQTKTSDTWEFSFDLDAGIPGFNLRDRYHSSSDAGFCSVQLDKTISHGSKKSGEKITFDQEKKKVKRENTTPGGGKGEYDVSACARDALTFIQFVRKELAGGRMAPQQSVVFGAAYQVRLEFTGTQKTRVGDQQVDSDRLVAHIKGPASDLTVELFFTKDAARTPVLVRIPLPLGVFTAELTR